MQAEIEVKFINVDINDVRERLTNAGAKLEHPMRMMRRVIIEPESLAGRDAFLRLRDEGDKVTMTFKEFAEVDKSDVKEIEVTVSDFDATLEMLNELGLHYRSFQESKRETWLLNEDVEVVIDEWPWLEPYIEIEGTSEAAIKQAAKALGFDWAQGVFGHVDFVYKRKFPAMTNRGVIDLKEVRFDMLSPVEFGEAV